MGNAATAQRSTKASGKARATTTGVPTPSLIVSPSLEAIDALDVDTFVLCLTPSMRPLPGAAGFCDWRLCGTLSQLIKRGILTGAVDEKVLMPADRIGIPRLLVLGLGDDPRKDSARKLDWLASTTLALGAERIAIAPPEPGTDWMGQAEQALVKSLGDRLVTLFAPEQ